MFVTSRSPLSTLGVILGVCALPATALAQSMSTGAPPTAGFADPTPEEQRLLSGEPAGPVAAGGSARAAEVSTEPSRAYQPPAAVPQYAPAPQRYAAPPYAPQGHAAPRYAYPQQPPASGYGYGYEGRASSYPGASSDPAADRGGDGASTRRDEKPEHFRIGVLGGVGFPRPLALEGMIKLEKVLGLGVEYSTMPGLTISGVDTSFWAVAATLRVFPFKDGFFIGVRGGRQHLGGEGTVTVAPYGTFRESVTVDTTFINPRIGFLWTWSPGLTLGIDAGVQIPVGATVASSLPAGTGVDQEVMDVARSIGDTTLPTIDLLKLGFLL